MIFMSLEGKPSTAFDDAHIPITIRTLVIFVLVAEQRKSARLDL